MKVIIAVLALVMISQAKAQTETVQVLSQPEVKAAKRTVVYDERTNQLVDVQPQVQGQTQSNTNVQPEQSSQSQNAPIYIMNSQKFEGSQDTGQIQSQPVSVVQESPLVPSASDLVRKKRQSVESETEDGIVSALERARLEDELKRRHKFSNAISSEVVIAPVPVPTTNAPVVQAPVVQSQVVQSQVVQSAAGQAPVVQSQVVQSQVVQAPVVHEPIAPKVETVHVVPAPVVREEIKEIRSEVRAELADAIQDRHPVRTSDFYVSGLVGYGTYADVRNIRGNLTGGFSVGMVTADRFVIDGSFLYGSYELEDLDPWTGGTPDFPRIVDMRQYNFMTGLKYLLLPNAIKPSVGALAGYTRRSYSEWGYDFETTDSLDLGLSAGLDIELTRSFTVGLDFRYMTNLATRKNTDYRESFVYPSWKSDIEKLDYYTTTLMGKFTF